MEYCFQLQDFSYKPTVLVQFNITYVLQSKASLSFTKIKYH